ncbi:MAG: molecular chaperone DnaK [Candidatus Nanopelagicales bacterium]
MPNPIAVGIDLGTTNTVVAILADGKPVVLPNAEGSAFTPSVVGFPESGEILVGGLARKLDLTSPERVVHSVKRQMGTEWSFPVDGHNWRPQEISARILAKVLRDATAACGQEITQAVVTVPAYFDDAGRQATRDAARIAGLEILRLVNEPTAAALAYGLDADGPANVLVFDLGGGTCDVSVLNVAGGVFEVLSTCGNVELGGTDWDARLAQWLLSQADPSAPATRESTDAVLSHRLLDCAETAKIALSKADDVVVEVPVPAAEGTATRSVALSRARFEVLTADLLQSAGALVGQAVADSGLAMVAIDHVVLVGGATRMPAVRTLLQDLTGKGPHVGIDPERVVAVGAALQAGVLSGERHGLLLVDVTPLSLGIETKGGVMTRLIERNRTVPTRNSQIFTTAADGQTSVEVHVLQGERPLASQNRSLGKFELTGIRRMSRGEPQIEVTFAIDADGIVHVSAEDLLTGQEQELTVTGQSGLAADVVEEMVEQAQAHAEEDRRTREDSGARNEAELALYHTERLLMEHGSNLGVFAGVLEGCADDLSFALEDGDVAAVRQAHKALLDALQAGAVDEGGSRGLG